jgi:hypothetical protein
VLATFHIRRTWWVQIISYGAWGLPVKGFVGYELLLPASNMKIDVEGYVLDSA